MFSRGSFDYRWIGSALQGWRIGMTIPRRDSLRFPVWLRRHRALPSEPCHAGHLTNRSSQPLAVVKSTFDFMKHFSMFDTLALASGGSASVSLIWLSICQGAKGVWCECLHRFHFKEGVGAGLRRLISRGELGSRRLVMLIFAGYPGCRRTYPHSFYSPQPWSNSLGDACSGWIAPALTQRDIVGWLP